MAGIKSESVADFIPESVADFVRNQHSSGIGDHVRPERAARLKQRSPTDVIVRPKMLTETRSYFRRTNGPTAMHIEHGPSR
jgi:hypothetical protein